VAGAAWAAAKVVMLAASVSSAMRWSVVYADVVLFCVIFHSSRCWLDLILPG
jgi:hypothetical protein